MKKILSALAVAVVLSGAAYAQDLQKGLAAAQAGDYATALQEWRPLAEQGYASAQFNLGTLYDYGQGVPQDYTEAVNWYRKAAEQGYAKAQFNSGNIDLSPKFPPALRGVLGVKSLSLSGHFVHHLSLQEFHRSEVAQG